MTSKIPNTMFKNTRFRLLMAFTFLVIIIACTSDDDTGEGPTTTNTAPTISAQSFQVSESAAENTIIGTITATDAENNTLSFRIVTNDNNLFALTNGGELSLASGQMLDFETAQNHMITVEVSDGTLTNTATITINVTDEAENTAPTIQAQSFNASEDIDDVTTIGTIVAMDAENDQITLSITINDNNLFELNNGELSLAPGQALDFETVETHTITVEASDGGLSSTAEITINVIDVAESTIMVTVTTFAGSTQGFADGTGTAALFNNPEGITVDSQGNLYVADSGNHRIRRIDPQGNVTTIAGSGTAAIVDGLGLSASFNFPRALVVDDDGNIFVSDNNIVRAIDVNRNVTSIAGNGVTGFADGIGVIARFQQNAGITLDNDGNIILVDGANDRIRFIDRVSGNVSTIAGFGPGFADGNGANALFLNPEDAVVDSNGDIFIVDGSNDRIRRIDPQGNVTTFAGGAENFADGNGTDARFNNPRGIAIDAQGNLYISDTGNGAIRRISPNGDVITLAGGNGLGFGDADGPGDQATFNFTERIAVDANGIIYVADSRNHRIRRIEVVEQ